MRSSALILLLLCGDVYAQAAATPLLRYKAVVDNLRNADTPALQLIRISDRLLVRAAPGQDVSAWTNAQKANAVLAWMRTEMRRSVEITATQVESAAVATTVSTNVATAVADMD